MLIARFALPLLVAAVPSTVRGETVDPAGFIGCWTRIDGVAFGKGEQRVCISEDLSAVWTTHDGAGRRTVVMPTHTIVGDLLVLSEEPREEAGWSKAVIGGWSLDGEAALFGTIYVYHGEEIVNGLFVVLANDAFAAELATRSWWD
ncbi:MAG TPA: hypothetical protein VF210_20875, partial [Pseudomonadales bacterium]